MSKHRTMKIWTAAGLLAVGLGWAAAAGATEVTDPWITTKVKASLLTADDVHGLDINVDTLDARVTLNGTVATAAEKTKAEQLAKQVEGVKQVRNLIQVVPSHMQKQVSGTDADIERRVKDALAADTSLKGISVQSVNKGVVVLAGKTDTLSEHLHALETARAVDGVTRVESEIQSPDKLADEEIYRDTPAVGAASGVKAKANDLWITTDAKVRLLAADVSSYDINVDTRAGVVTLFGSVPNDAAKKDAEMEVRKVAGVSSVKNELQVVPAAKKDMVERKDDQIKDTVEKRLETRQDLADSKIGVEVQNGVVRLTGKVASQTDRLAALTTARTSDGVRSVVGDDLRVEHN